MYKLRIILAMFIFGTLGLFVKNINLASSEIAFWRAAIAIVVLCVCLIFSKRKNKRKILLKPCSGFRSIFEKLSKRLSENLYKNQEIEVLEKSIKNYKEV